MEENAIEINGGIKINVDLNLESITYGKRLSLESYYM